MLFGLYIYIFFNYDPTETVQTIIIKLEVNKNLVTQSFNQSELIVKTRIFSFACIPDLTPLILTFSIKKCLFFRASQNHILIILFIQLIIFYFSISYLKTNASCYVKILHYIIKCMCDL